MKFFKIRKKNDYSAVQTVPAPAKTHPFYELNNYNPRVDAEYELYTLLREAVPIIDAAICKTVRLVGSFKINCEDKEVEFLLNQFISHVKVNSCENGLNAFISTYLDQMLTYGTAIGEIVPNTLTMTLLPFTTPPSRTLNCKLEKIRLIWMYAKKMKLGGLFLCNTRICCWLLL